MSYTYRDRDRDWDEPRSPVSIKRYVIPPEDERDHRGMVTRRPADRDSHSGMVSRYDREADYDPRRYDHDYYRDYYEREYSQPPGVFRNAAPPPIIICQGQPVIIDAARGYAHPRDSEYDFADRDPGHHHHRDRRLRRELSPADSISQTGRRRDDDYSSDDSMVYVRRGSRERDEHPNHRRHMAEGALVGVGAAELIRNRRKKEGDDVSNGVGRVGQGVGAGALGAVAVEAASRAKDYYRSQSRHRSHSYDDDRGSHGSRHRHRRHGHHRNSHSLRSRSRTRSHSRAKTLAGWGLGAAAVAGAVALARSKSNNNDRRSRSRHRRAPSSRRPKSRDERGDNPRGESQRRKHMAGAGLAGAAAVGIADKARSHSRFGKSRSRSRSKFRKALPIVAGGLGTAAATGLYEKHKDKKDDDDDDEDGGSKRRERRRRSRSRSGPSSEAYPDPSRDSAGLIEYGDHPVHGSIPAAGYYGRPPTPPSPGYYSDASDPVASGAAGYGSSRRSRSRGGRYSDSLSDSDRGSRRRRRTRKGRKEADIDRDRLRFEDEVHNDPYETHDPYEESYNPMPYSPSPPSAPRPIENDHYPNSNYFPPPPGSGPRQAGNPRPYHPADYPPPPGAAPPPQSYGYPPPPGPEPYAARPRKVDEYVSTRNFLPQYHVHDGLRETNSPERRRTRAASQPPKPKSVTFDLDTKSSLQDRHLDPGYETDDSDSTIDSISKLYRHNSRQRRNSSSDRYRYSPSRKHNIKHDNTLGHQPSLDKLQRSDSDSTIDLPDRFDSRGRLLPQEESRTMPMGDPLEELLMKGLNKVFA